MITTATQDQDFSDYHDPIPHAFCDVPEPHESHAYVAINGIVYDCSGVTAAELAEAPAYTECEHGLSADLCSGPMHY